MAFGGEVGQRDGTRSFIGAPNLALATGGLRAATSQKLTAQRVKFLRSEAQPATHKAIQNPPSIWLWQKCRRRPADAGCSQGDGCRWEA